MRRRVLLAVAGATGSAASMLSTDREPFGVDRRWMATPTTLVGLFMRRSFIMHHCFAVIWRRSLELNPCRIKFIKNQGVALWQRRRRRVRRRKRKRRDLRLEHREILIRQAAGPEFGRFRLCCSKKQTGHTVADRQVLIAGWLWPLRALPLAPRSTDPEIAYPQPRLSRMAQTPLRA
jgi:hypothetical protein